MALRWGYRIGSFAGVSLLTIAAVVIASQSAVQAIATSLPIVSNLPVTSMTARYEMAIEAGTTLIVVLGALAPFFTPRPRRALDIVMLSQKRIVIALFVLAAIGYFDYTYRLPRLTLVITAAMLLVSIPAWLVAIRRRPRMDDGRAIIIGDDPEGMEAIMDDNDAPVVGYVTSVSRYWAGNSHEMYAPEVADGGVGVGGEPLDELTFLGGISRLDDILVEHDVGVALLAFSHPDRWVFFGTLDTCHEHGITAKVHRDHADSVLTADFSGSELVEIDLEPWDLQEYILKRVFDLVFAVAGLIILAPIIISIAVAIRLDSPGPILFSQERTAELGRTFDVYKFRSMHTDAEAESGVTLSVEDVGESDPRVTRVGRVLRRTHMDEIPQLWSIIVGHMSVVGPRPERPELDIDMERDVGEWRRRWFVKPGLTGLAQINGVTGFQPTEKLRYDVEYIRNQSFWFDLKIIVRQLWLVGSDVVSVLWSRPEK